MAFTMGDLANDMNEVKKKALISFVDIAAQEEPSIMVPHSSFVMAMELNRLLMNENRSLKEELEKSKSESKA